MKNPSDDNFERRVSERLFQWEEAPTRPQSQRRWKSLLGILARDQLQRSARRERWLVAAILLLLWPAGWGIYHFLFVEHHIPFASQSLNYTEPLALEDSCYEETGPAFTQYDAGTVALPDLEDCEEEESRINLANEGGRENINQAIGNQQNRATTYRTTVTNEGAGETGETVPLAATEITAGQDSTILTAWLSRIENLGPQLGPFLLEPLAILIVSIKSPAAPPVAEDDPKPPVARAAYATLMPLMNYQQVVPNPEDEFYVASLNQPGIASPSRLGYRAAVGYEQQLFDSKFTAHAEAAYTFRRGQFAFRYHGTEPDTSVWSTGPNGSVDYTPVYQIRQGAFSYTSHSVGVQLGLQYEITDWFGGHYLLAGYEGAWVIQEEKITLEEASEQIQATPQHLLTFGYRFDRPLNDRWSFRLQPSIRYAMRRPDLPELPVSVQPFSYGLNLGVVYHWGRGR